MSAATVTADHVACFAVRTLRFFLRLLPIRFVVGWPCGSVLHPIARLFLARRSQATLEAAWTGLNSERRSDASLVELVQRSTLHIARTAAIFLRLPLSEEELKKYVTIDQASRVALSEDLERGGCIIVSAHFGGFELIIPALLAHLSTSLAGKEVVVPYKPLHLRHLNDLVLSIRKEISHDRCHFMPSKGSMGVLQSVINRGGVVGMLPDQRSTSGSCLLPFLGRQCRCMDGFARLQISTAAPVWFVTCELTDEHSCSRESGRYDQETCAHVSAFRLCSGSACDLERGTSASGISASAAADTVSRYNRLLEKAIMRTPCQYLWAHDRWRAKEPCRSPI